MARRGRGTTLQARFKPIREADVQSRTNAATFTAGREIQQRNAFSQLIVRDSGISGWVRNPSEKQRYWVEVCLSNTRDRDDRLTWRESCTCGTRRNCAHIIALLLAWIATPDRFIVRPEISTLLRSQQKHHLEGVLDQLLDEHPELTTKVEALLAEDGTAVQDQYNEDEISNLVSAALGNPDDWDPDGDALEDLRTQGDLLAEIGQWRQAQLIYAGIIEGILQHEYAEAVSNQEGIPCVLHACMSGLIDCFSAQDQLRHADRLLQAEREQVLRIMIDCWVLSFDSNPEHLSLPCPRALIPSLSVAERQRAEGRLRAVIAASAARAGDHYHGSDEIMQLILQLRGIIDPETGEITSQEAALSEYLADRLWRQAANTLIDLGRIDEAVALADEKMGRSSDICNTAARLSRHGDRGAAVAIGMMERHIARIDPIHSAHYEEIHAVLPMLVHRYVAMRRGVKAYDALHRMCLYVYRPYLREYQGVREVLLAGSDAAYWPAMRRELFRILREKECWEEIARLLTKEATIPEAMEALALLRQRGEVRNYHQLVAEVAERDYPNEAIICYEIELERVLGARAAPLLVGILPSLRALFERQGRDWNAYLAHLRQRPEHATMTDAIDAALRMQDGR